MDFSRIYDEWERGQSSKQGQSPPDKDFVPPPSVTRAQMEHARVDEVLDLHGMTSEAATEAVRDFLGQSAAEGLTKVLIIHGKGLHSQNSRSVLSEAVRKVLSKNPNVAAWGEAEKKQGGRGASWVWLSARGK